MQAAANVPEHLMKAFTFLAAGLRLTLHDLKDLLMFALHKIVEHSLVTTIVAILAIVLVKLGLQKRKAKRGAVKLAAAPRKRRVWRVPPRWRAEWRMAWQGVAILAVSGAMFGMVREMITMHGQIDGAKDLQTFATVLILPKERGDGLIEGKAVFADQGGHFIVRWMWPGDYQMLILAQSGGVLRYSVAQYSQGWLGGKNIISTNPLEMKLHRKVLDKFAFDKAELPSGAEQTFQVTAPAAEFADCIYLLMGHADSMGDDGYNEALALQRARKSAGVLLDQHIPANRIIVVSLGSRIPAPRLAGTAGTDALDRRVVLLLVPDPYALPANLVGSRF